MYDTPLAIDPRRLVALQLLSARARGIEARPAIEARAALSRTPRRAAAGTLAVIPLHGTVSQRGDFLDALLGGGSISTESITWQVRAALADDSISGILLDIDSPGGAVTGVQELAAVIHAARERKPVYAIANCLAASAAYWIGSAATKLYATPSGEVGSIGVFAMHRDYSAAMKKEGIKTTFISAGPYKVEGNAFEPLSAEAKDYMQSRIDDYYGQFVRDVARGRGVSAATVRASYGGGRVMGAAEALKAGLVDGVATYGQVLSRLAVWVASGGKSALSAVAYQSKAQTQLWIKRQHALLDLYGA